jgi:hypothetical protein
MVGMLMSDKYRLYIFNVQAKPAHPLLGLAAGDAGIDQNSFGFVADIITVPVAARIK